MSLGAGNCDTSISELGSDGRCYAFCIEGWTPVDNGPLCAKNCPPGYATSSTVPGSTLACVRPHFPREIKPQLTCPPNADRQFDKCLLGCPTGTRNNFNLCLPECPKGFVTTPDGLSCQAEFIKRVSTVREACYANETRIDGRTCLAPCSAGTQPLPTNVELCYSVLPANVRPYFWTGDSNFASNIGPIVAKVIFPRTQVPATCSQFFEAYTGTCYGLCPTGSTALATQCVVDCPQGFKNIGNQTACLRPTIGRAVVESRSQQTSSAISRIIIFIVVIMGVAMLASAIR